MLYMLHHIIRFGPLGWSSQSSGAMSSLTLDRAVSDDPLEAPRLHGLLQHGPVVLLLLL